MILKLDFIRFFMISKPKPANCYIWIVSGFWATNLQAKQTIEKSAPTLKLILYFIFYNTTLRENKAYPN